MVLQTSVVKCLILHFFATLQQGVSIKYTFINGLIELKITQRRPNYFHWKVNIDTFLSSSFLVNVPLFEKSSKSHRAIIVEQNRSKELGNKHLTNFKLFEFDLLQTYNLIHSFLFDGIGILIGCLVLKKITFTHSSFSLSLCS